MPTALERYLRDPRTIVLTLILAACSAHSCLAQVTIQVNTTQQGQTNNQCSLQEAIYAAELKSNIAISSTNPDTFYGTGCVAGPGLGDNAESIAPQKENPTQRHTPSERRRAANSPERATRRFSPVLKSG